MMTGDASVNPGAPIICCTAEVLANIALRDGDQAEAGLVVMDEFHFYADPDRGWAWQIPLLELPQSQFLLMSATLGDVERFEADLKRRTGKDTVTVRSAERPVPLSYSYRMTPLHETVQELLEGGQAPIYIVHFTQAAAIERAQSLMSLNVCSRAEKDAIAELLGGFRFTTRFGRTLSRFIRHGIGVHHAGMLPKYRRLVERLAQAGLLKVICGTDTLGVGVNVPIRTVLFTALSKYDGRRSRLLRAREFHQIAGRAGRAGFDTIGYVAAQAPDHVIENERALAKIGDDPKRRRGYARKKPPEGFVNWSEQTFEKLIDAEPEPLVSRFQVTHAMLLSIIARPGNAFEAMRKLLTDNHEPPAAQRKHIHRAIAIYRSLLAAGVVERLDTPDETGRIVRLTVDLQQDFALNQALSTFALAAFDLLDPESPVLRPGPALHHRVDPRRPAPDPDRPGEEGARRGDRRDEGLRHRVRGADGARGRHQLPQAARGDARPRLRHLPPRPPVDRRPPGQPQVRGARDVRAGDDLRGLHRRLRPRPRRGHRAQVPGRRLPHAQPHHPRVRQERRPRRPDRMARRDGPPDRLQPRRRVGGPAQPRGACRRPKPPSTTPRPPSPATAAHSGCWSAMPCSAA